MKYLSFPLFAAVFAAVLLHSFGTRWAPDFMAAASEVMPAPIMGAILAAFLVLFWDDTLRLPRVLLSVGAAYGIGITILAGDGLVPALRGGLAMVAAMVGAFLVASIIVGLFGLHTEDHPEVSYS